MGCNAPSNADRRAFSDLPYNARMTPTTPLANQLLIAMPGLRDPDFARAVTLLCQHDAEGSMGIMINRMSEYRLGDVLAQMDMHSELPAIVEAPVLIGGPVQPERGFVLHTPHGKWESSIRVSPNLSVTTSRDILLAIAAGEGPRQAVVALGYASWGPGQIEQELRDNAWLTAPASDSVLFDIPLDQRWQAAGGLLGVDLVQLAGYVGHA